ncbi:MAG: hypothetical protein APF84_12310 [Gracilibacter sp. BRH_c7a]|nr:MAG: hypothetical protein APF84_12310 [Gracilibacter sp. BRH_c7a]
MPWCPKCKTEYRDGFYNCSDCGSDLVDEIDIQTPTEDITAGPPQDIDWEYLDIFIDEQEANMIESFLNSDNIHTWKKYPGFSDISKIVGGMTRLGIAIYVPKARLDDARLIVEDILGAKDEQLNQAEEYSENLSTTEPDISLSSSFIKILFIGTLIAFIYKFFLSP